MKLLGIIFYLSATTWAISILWPLYSLAIQGFTQIGRLLP